MLTNSRAVATASAIAADRVSVALVSLVRGEGTRSSTRASGCESGPGAVMDDLNSVKLYAPNANPSAAAPRSRIESVVATVSMPDSERAAAPADLRICSLSSLSAEPSPTARTLVTDSALGAGTRVSCSGLPVAPTAMRLSRISASTSSATMPSLSAISGPSGPDVRPTTNISARLATVPARTRSGPNDRAVRVLKVSPVR